MLTSCSWISRCVTTVPAVKARGSWPNCSRYRHQGRMSWPGTDGNDDPFATLILQLEDADSPPSWVVRRQTLDNYWSLEVVGWVFRIEYRIIQIQIDLYLCPAVVLDQQVLSIDHVPSLSVTGRLDFWSKQMAIRSA